MNKPVSAIVLLMCLGGMVGAAAGMEITPFRTVNQSPLIRIFGMPAESEATVVPKGHFSASLVQDVASNYTVSKNAREQISLDGESYRWTLAGRYGFGNRYEMGIEIPYLLEGGGFLDSFIVDWHNTFSLPQGGRDSAPKNRLNYSYRKDGIQKLDMHRAGSGIGDISLTGAIKLYDQQDKDSHDSLALRAAIKLPTGDTSSLRGSGSLDTSLSLCGSMNNFTEWGALGVFGSLGGMALTDGKVLADQQQHLVGFGTLGIGWGPADWISFKFQLNGNTAFYRGSSLAELSKASVVLVSGGALRLPGNYRLDIGVSEDVMVATAPDVAFHLGLSRQF
ncbi:MAG TPA: DUF3187 family protein [Desulfuromonadaceae bacterium]